ncbi:polysaccharide deacetylase family protein [Bradyrhizobium australiense]|uniref:Chitooligosaccharide deacetylase n=1 Tax=Bradyrhizobium australiense TaxID=2721161 RepID=A0A7Y4GWP9_9BRAD|nr:polysaccharide deacetylase family protein [Bradyrhizobium australiense]NOJ43326.1 polysaccharide deacetylase family protein [Bradyrhizobium australiense]
MKPATYITTSWDDGHSSDLRVAALLTKRTSRGTFYVPMSAETSTMTTAQIRELGSGFEIGAHTIHHDVLTKLANETAWREVAGSKSRLEDTTGQPCRMFCPPKGRYSRPHLAMIRRAGFVGLRTVELGSLDFPRRRAGLARQRFKRTPMASLHSPETQSRGSPCDAQTWTLTE